MLASFSSATNCQSKKSIYKPSQWWLMSSFYLDLYIDMWIFIIQFDSNLLNIFLLFCSNCCNFGQWLGSLFFELRFTDNVPASGHHPTPQFMLNIFFASVLFYHQFRWSLYYTYFCVYLSNIINFLLLIFNLTIHDHKKYLSLAYQVSSLLFAFFQFLNFYSFYLSHCHCLHGG